MCGGDVWRRLCLFASCFNPLLLLCRLESSKLHGGLYRRDNKPCETTEGLLLCFVTARPILKSLQETAGAPFLANGVPAFLFLPAASCPGRGSQGVQGCPTCGTSLLWGVLRG